MSDLWNLVVHIHSADMYDQLHTFGYRRLNYICTWMYRVNEIIRRSIHAVLITKGFERFTKIRMLQKELHFMVYSLIFLMVKLQTIQYVKVLLRSFSNTNFVIIQLFWRVLPTPVCLVGRGIHFLLWLDVHRDHAQLPEKYIQRHLRSIF